MAYHTLIYSIANNIVIILLGIFVLQYISLIFESHRWQVWLDGALKNLTRSIRFGNDVVAENNDHIFESDALTFLFHSLYSNNFRSREIMIADFVTVIPFPQSN